MSSQNHCEFCISTTGLGCCEIYSKIIEKIKKIEMNWPQNEEEMGKNTQKQQIFGFGMEKRKEETIAFVFGHIRTSHICICKERWSL